jgi:hypothetical protein
MSNVLEKILNRKHAKWENVMDGENGANFRHAARRVTTEFELVEGSVSFHGINVKENAMENLQNPSNV